MPFDPTYPPSNAPLVSAAMRNQFNGLQSNIQAKASEDECLSRLLTCANNPLAVGGLGMVINDPPTAGEVQAIADKLDELIAVLKRE